MGLDPEFPEYEAGDDCPHCAAELYFQGTPKYVYMKLSSITICPGAPEDPNGTHLLPQMGPCLWWKFFGLAGSIVFEHTPFNTNMVAGDGIWTYFLGTPVAKCDSFATNLLAACGPPGVGGIGGIAQVYWGPTLKP